MRISGFGHYALTCCVATALLAGCGGSQPPIGAPGGSMLPNSRSSGFRVLARFDQSDGRYPTGLMVFRKHVYGATAMGGADERGVLYEVSAAGHIKLLYSFNGDDGSAPTPPTADRGVLYGTTGSGGYDGYGSIYKYANGELTHLADFPGSPSGGAHPNGLTLLNSSLYGTTSGGGSSGVGTVFELTASGIKTIYNFLNNGHDGLEPFTALTAAGGILYGVTNAGGAYKCGTVYKITTSGQESVIYNFGEGYYDAKSPVGALVKVNGNFYGATYSGGQSDSGTVFEVSPSGKERVLYSFSYGPAGMPDAGLLYLNGRLYGTTSAGPSYEGGTIFSLTPSGTKMRVVHNFGSFLGYKGSASTLVALDGALYGTADEAGRLENGALFRLRL
jgi:uncharacterized repeat protein (TIGR03803 family)